MTRPLHRVRREYTTTIEVPRTRRLQRPAAVTLAAAAEPSVDRSRDNGVKKTRKARVPRKGGAELLTTDRITVRFGGLVANDEVSVSVPLGRVTALIGPNGAGKTTFFNVLTGAQQSSSGDVYLDGDKVTGASRSAMAKLGAARTFQNLQIFESLTVEENVLVGASRFVRSGPVESLIIAPRARRDERLLRAVARQALEMTGLAEYADTRAADLSYGLRRRAEIARALAVGPRILFLDEPSAGMDGAETMDLGSLISRIVDELGIAVFLVEHDMSMVREFVDYVYVLDFGRLLIEGRPLEVLQDAAVVEAYLGSREGAHA